MEPERCPSFATAMKMGTPVFTPTLPSLADGLTVPTVGCNALATAGNFSATFLAFFYKTVYVVDNISNMYI